MNKPSGQKRLDAKATATNDEMHPLAALKQAARNALKLAGTTGTSFVILERWFEQSMFRTRYFISEPTSVR